MAPPIGRRPLEEAMKGSMRQPRTTRSVRFAMRCTTVIIAAGCQPPESGIRSQTPPRAGDGSLPGRMEIGRSVEGRPIECVVIGHGPDTVHIIASIHGDEPAGTPLVEKLITHLDGAPELAEGRRIVVVPNANPDGMAAGLRHNVRGVDLNRNFPASNYNRSQPHGNRPLSEPESRALNELFRRYPPDRVVSIHQPRSLPPCVDYDGPGEALAVAMSRVCDLPMKKLGSRPGSMGSYVGLSLGVPIITVEIPRFAEDGDGDVLWQRYGRMLLAAIEFR
jgi:protein MpaA